MGKKRVSLVSAVMLFSFLALNVKASLPTVINFDNLSYDTTLSGTNYSGLTWEWGNQGHLGDTGDWWIPSQTYNYPYSSPHNVINGYGITLLGVSFPTTVNVQGAYFAGAGEYEAYFADAIRIHGYRSGAEVGLTSWFTDIDTHPDWFAINLNNVDRIVIEADPGITYAFYGMDNLTYEVPEPTTLLLLGLGGLFLRRK